MRPLDVWSKNVKFIEVGMREGVVGVSLMAAGFQRFLGIVPSEKRRADLCDGEPELDGRVVCSRDAKAVRRNNADVLIVSSRWILSLWRFKNFRHAGHIAWYLRPELLSPLAAFACLGHLLCGRLAWPKVVRCDAGARRRRRLLVFEVRRRKVPTAARHYIPHSLGIHDFLDRLGTKQIRYVVLRWFESLPRLPEGEDLDLLIDDDSLETVRQLLQEGPGVQPCDLYTVTGLPGSDYRNMPYYPPLVAQALLEGAQSAAGDYRVPAPGHHFMSLAYHALYHKGAQSGLPNSDGRRGKAANAEHDYTNILGTLAQRCHVAVPITFEDLDQYLDQQGWRPPHDMLVRLARHNRSLRRLLGSDDQGTGDPGLAVFVMRQEAIERGGLDTLVPMLEHEGFHVLRAKQLSPEEVKVVSGSIRGGNWGRGPWGISGGLPAAVVVAYDTEPVPPKASQKKKFPHCTNARLLRKSKIRDAFNEGYPSERSCNVIHSSDNGREAMEYMRIAMPEAVDQIVSEVQQLSTQYSTKEPVLGTLTEYGRRAKIEIIPFNGRFAVKKTFKPHSQRFCLRETEAMRELSHRVPEVPPLVDVEELAVVYPYYDDVLRYRRSSGKLLPLSIAKQAIEALRDIYEAGYALIDAHTENLLVDRQEGLKLIDFEFLHRYQKKPPCFEQSYDIVGCPVDFQGDLPDGGAKTYSRSWQPHVGLSLESLLHDSPWLQHLKRTVYYLVHVNRFLPRRIRHYYRAIRQAFTRNAPSPLSTAEANARECPKRTRAA